jgi:fructokinase
MADPNARPSAVRDRTAYLDRLDAIFARADVVKVSTEDLAYLEPSAEPAEMARTLLGRGPRVVLVTDGGDAARVVTGDRVVEVPVPSVVVVDTVGAGDSFGGAFLAWWAAHGFGREELGDVARVVAATTVAVDVAAVTCTRRGADPPTRADLGERWSTAG